MRQNGALSYLLSDHLGSTSRVTNQGGSRVRIICYNPWGYTQAAWGSGTAAVKYTYTGKELDAGTGLMYYGARYYDPALGRFVQPDTIVPEPGDPQALNRYAYVYNNPLRYTDPSGRRPTSGCEYEGCSLRPGLLPDSAWQLPDGTQLPYDPQLAAAYSNSPLLDPQTTAIVQTAVGFLCEWCDWGMTFYAWSQGDFSWWDLAGLLPILPAAGVRSARHADDLYQGVRQASEYLQRQGVSRRYRKQIIESFEIETIQVRLAGPNEFGIRYYDDVNAPARGRYLFETFPASRESLAIKPEWNQMTRLQQWQIRPGTIIIEGRVASQGPGYPGGQIQKFILYPDRDLSP